MSGVGIGGIGVFALIATTTTGAVLALFTPVAFAFLGYHPIAVEYVLGSIDAAVLLVFRYDGLGFTPGEISHLADVKSTIGYVRIGFGAALVLCTVLALLSGRAFRAACLWAPGVFIAIGGAVVLAYFTVGFQAVGSLFHRVFFPQGNWQFPFSSLIIRLYGTQEMIIGTVFVLATALVLLVGIAGAAWWGLRHQRGSPDPENPLGF